MTFLFRWVVTACSCLTTLTLAASAGVPIGVPVGAGVVAGRVPGRQLMDVAGDPNTLQWIAVVKDGADCDAVQREVDELRNVQGASVSAAASTVDTLTNEAVEDCYITFSGPQTFADIVIEQVDAIVAVEANEEVGFFAPVWNLDRIDQDALPLDNADYAPPFPGYGVSVYVIDTGIYPSHNDFGGRARIGADFVNEGRDDDMHGHGTHTASTAVGQQYGVAPGAEVIGVKVLSASGSGSTSGVIQGVQWAVADAGGKAAVISMSLGGGRSTAMNRAVETASKSHIVVVAAGNENQDACNVSPASAQGDVITVGATTVSDARSSFSNHGECVDIFAPGSSIRAAGIAHKTSTSVKSGTSMATPHVAGAAAQALQKSNGDLQAALDDLYATAEADRITNVGFASPNRLLRTFSYTGPPTPPTVKPTVAPTMSNPVICGAEDDCTSSFENAQFGADPLVQGDDPIVARIVNAAYGDQDSDVHSVGTLCEPTDQDLSGAFVRVMRGDCLFFDKAKNAEFQGARGVIIQNYRLESLFAPVYYGDDKTSVHVMMVGYNQGENVFTEGSTFKWGSPELIEDAVLTLAPTVAPTPAPTEPTPPDCDGLENRKACRQEVACRWNNKKGMCILRKNWKRRVSTNSGEDFQW